MSRVWRLQIGIANAARVGKDEQIRGRLTNGRLRVHSLPSLCRRRRRCRQLLVSRPPHHLLVVLP